MDAGAVSGRDEVGGRVPGEPEKDPQPAGAGGLCDDAEYHAQFVADDETSPVIPIIVESRTSLSHPTMSMLLLQLN